jgi:hypothetical protein
LNPARRRRIVPAFLAALRLSCQRLRNATALPTSRKESEMKHIPQAICQTADEIYACIRAREQDAATLPPGEPKQSVLKEIAQLRVYAEAERRVDPPAFKPGG